MSQNPIQQTYNASLKKIQEILFSQSASRKEKNVAEQALKDLTTAMLMHNLKTIEGRTALLSSLIVELREVIDNIQPKSPVADVAKKLTQVVNKAKKLFKTEKESPS